jgi:Reverse transcriptase (RNA-dependent DNA polymerase)
LIVLKFVWGLTAALLDVEVAFLNGELEEKICMECPKGIVRQKDDIVELLKSMYGLVQAARQFFLKFCKILKKVGFEQNPSEPCLFHKKAGDHMVLMAIHVDDCYIIGKKDSIEHVVKDIEKEGLKLKVEFNTKDYLSCEILFDRDEGCAWLGQPHQVKKIASTYKDLIEGCQSYKTPGTPNQGIVPPGKDDLKISNDEQSIYRSVVGSLLHLVKHSRPDIANSVRELATCMDGANQAAYKEMKRLLKFVIDTRSYGLKMHPFKDRTKQKWVLTAYSDSDWAGDKSSRKSVSGYSVFLMGAVILWKSKLQKPVALSSSEAEYYALSEAAIEIKFVF